MPTFPLVFDHDSIPGRVVVRDDALPGGSKVRALVPVLERTGGGEYVYASPTWGGAQVAVAAACRLLGEGYSCRLFLPARRDPSPPTLEAMKLGAEVEWIKPGYLNVVQARARSYEAAYGFGLEDGPIRRLLPFGLDVPVFRNAFVAAVRPLLMHDFDPPEVWVAAGSGFLTRCLQDLFPRARHYPVEVGRRLSSAERGPHAGQALFAEEKFEAAARRPPPFPSNANYDAKVYALFTRFSKPGALYWNVAS